MTQPNWTPAEQQVHDRQIEQYKHIDTRAYLNLDQDGRAWDVAVHPTTGQVRGRCPCQREEERAMSDTSAPPLEQVHEQIRTALPAMPQAACLDNNHRQPRIDYLGASAELLPQLCELADRHGWTEADGSVQLTTDGLRITLSSNHPR